VPFAALAQPVAAARPPRGSAVRYLIEEKPVAVMTSTALWDDVFARDPVGDSLRGSWRVAVFGPPDGSLPGADAELSRLRRLFPDAVVHTREDATPDQVRHLPPDTRVTHFATHGILDARATGSSYLLMARQARLTLAEIRNLRGAYPSRM